MPHGPAQAVPSHPQKPLLHSRRVDPRAAFAGTAGWHRWLAWLAGLAWLDWLNWLVALQVVAWVLGGLLFAWLPLQAWVKSADAVAKPQAALPAQWARALASAAPPPRGGT